MIQRIQSVFLFLAAACCFGPFALPFAQSPEGAVLSSGIFADGVYNLADQISLPIIFALAGLFALVTIFLFKRRKLQMRMAMLTAIIVFFAMAFVVVFLLQDPTAEVTFDIKAGVIFPPLAFLFALLGHRYIKKDEKLVRSMDRLR